MTITENPLKSLLRKLSFRPKEKRMGAEASQRGARERRVGSTSSVAPETNKPRESVLMSGKEVLIEEKRPSTSTTTTATADETLGKSKYEEVLNLSKVNGDLQDHDQQVLDQLWGQLMSRKEVLIEENRPSTMTTTDQTLGKSKYGKVLNLSKANADLQDHDQQVLDELWSLYFQRQANAGAEDSSSDCLLGGRMRYGPLVLRS